MSVVCQCSRLTSVSVECCKTVPVLTGVQELWVLLRLSAPWVSLMRIHQFNIPGTCCYCLSKACPSGGEGSACNKKKERKKKKAFNNHGNKRPCTHCFIAFVEGAPEEVLVITGWCCWVISISTCFRLWGDSSCSHQSARNSQSTRVKSLSRSGVEIILI